MRINQSMSWLLFVSRIFASLLLLGAVLTTTANGQLAWQADPQLESAILKEDWSKVVSVLGPDKTLSPSAKLVKAHALLAVNRNNESLCLFLSTSSDDDLKQWEVWTQDFAKRHPQKAIAHYFRGDAFARLGQWDGALAEFREALKIRMDHALVLNARGVTYAAKAAWDQALLDFDAAAKAGPRFADAYASRGAMYIQRMDGAEGAAKAFTRALELSPDFVLALNGRGGVRTVLGAWEEAKKDLAEAEKQIPACLSAVLTSVRLNMTALSNAEAEALSKALPMLAKTEPGMDLSTAFRTPQEVAQAKGVLMNAAGWNQRQLGNPLMPSNVTAQMRHTMEVGSVGGMPFIRGQMTTQVDATIEPRTPMQHNFNHQMATLNYLNTRYPNISATPVGNVQAWILNRTNPSINSLTHAPAGGVSTEAIASAHTDAGDWSVTTQYGLLYPMRETPHAAARRDAR